MKNITKFLNGKKTKTIGKKRKPRFVLKFIGEPKPLTDLKFKIKKKHVTCVKKIIVKVVKPDLDKVSVKKIIKKYLEFSCICPLHKHMSEANEIKIITSRHHYL